MTRAAACGLIVVAALVSGCSMSSEQKQHIQTLEQQAAAIGHPEIKYVQTKDPDKAFGLGFLFGIGYFYTDSPGKGIASLLTWPLSITWAPFGAYNTALEDNIDAFEARVQAAKDAQLGFGPQGGNATSPDAVPAATSPR
ncbi:hypothetical protein K2Z84_19505 [Candidatus Binatia bacterium]|nr:hypothetical protein [Candidatus Binatia bacterium]